MTPEGWQRVKELFRIALEAIYRGPLGAKKGIDKEVAAELRISCGLR